MPTEHTPAAGSSRANGRMPVSGQIPAPSLASPPIRFPTPDKEEADCAVAVADVSRTFGGRSALRGITFTVSPGERVALIGPSGSGKSTLLRLIAGLLAADRDSGPITIHGRTMQQAGRIDHDARRIRAGVGFVFQQFNLIGRLSVLKNVLVGRLTRVPSWRSIFQLFTLAERRIAMAALARVGLADRAAQRASTLSGGQQQRVAIARAICQGARVILADEPIASLDPESARKVMELLADLARTEGASLLVSLHQVDLALRYCDRVIALFDGQVRFDGPSTALTAAELISIYGGSWTEQLEGNSAGARDHPVEEKIKFVA